MCGLVRLTINIVSYLSLSKTLKQKKMPFYYLISVLTMKFIEYLFLDEIKIRSH